MAPPANHWLFQCANSCLLLSYSARDVLILRVLLMCAGVFFVLWGGIILEGSVDTITWNSLFTAINALRATEVAWSRRPIRFERPEHEEIYQQVFEPVGIGRLTFKLLVSHGLLRRLRAGTTILEAGNEVNSLTLLYSGSIVIISSPKDGREPATIGTIRPMQFIESPQFANMQIQRSQKAQAAAAAMATTTEEARSRKEPIPEASLHPEDVRTDGDGGDNEGDQSLTEEDEEELGMIATSNARDKDMRAASTVEVTFRAETDIIFFTWPIEVLQDFMHRNPNTSAPLNAIIGADVATKLFSQAKHGEGEMISSIQRRIYLPMDEPRAAVVLPVQGESTMKKTMHGKEKPDTSSILDDLSTTSSVSSHHTMSPIVAEKMWLERRGAHDTAYDKKLAVLLQRRTDLNQYEMSALIAKGRWRSILRTGTVLMREGEPTTFLAMVLTGSFAVTKGESDAARQLHTVRAGQLLGSLEFNEPEREHLAGETVTSLEPCVYIVWDLDDLRQLLKPRPRLRAHLTALVAADLSLKFRQVQEVVGREGTNQNV